MHIYISGNPQIMLQFCLNLFDQCSKGKNQCLGLQVARMKKGLHLEKNWPSYFKFIALPLGKLSKTLIMIYTLFENSLCMRTPLKTALASWAPSINIST